MMRQMRTYSLSMLIILTLLFPNLARARDTRSHLLLSREINFMIKRSNTPRTIKAIEIYSRKHNKVIFHSYSDLLLRPASNLKIVTSSFILHSLGSNYIFRTLFSTTGTRQGGTVDGDLVITAAGDPIVDLADIDSAAGIISQKGVKTIDGNLIVDISRFDSLQWGSGWMWDDEPESYAMFISPACLDHNSIEVCVSIDSTTHKLVVTTQPNTDFVKVVCTAVQDTVDSLFVTRVMINDVNTILVEGRYPPQLEPSTYEFSVRHPAEYFGIVFKEILEKHGVDLRGDVVVRYHRSTSNSSSDLFALEDSIDTVMTYTNKVSDNLGAECLLRQVPMAEEGKAGGAGNSIDLEKGFLKECGVDSTEYYIVDGSGLSHYDLITPEAIVKILNYDLDQRTKNLFMKTLPIAGVDGTLKRRMEENFLVGRVIAKTGSISGVSTLSGYVIVPRDTLIFSMMMQNFIGDTDSMRSLQDSVCSVLALYDDNAKVFTRHLKKHDVGTYGEARHRRGRHIMEANFRRAKKKSSTD